MCSCWGLDELGIPEGLHAAWGRTRVHLVLLPCRQRLHFSDEQTETQKGEVYVPTAGQGPESETAPDPENRGHAPGSWEQRVRLVPKMTGMGASRT